MKKKFFVLLAALVSLLAFLAVFSAAISTQSEEIVVNASEVSSLIRVQSDFSFEQLIPGREYSTTVGVEWNIPDAALKNLVEEKIVLHVRAEPRTQDSWIYFKKQGGITKRVSLQLICSLENQACGNGSTLSQTITAFYKAPIDAKYPHEDGLRVTAFVEPPRTQEEILFEQQAQQKIVEYEKKIVVLQTEGAVESFAVSELSKQLEQAREALEDRRLEELRQKLAEIEAKIKEIEKRLSATPTPSPEITEIEEKAGAEEIAATNGGKAGEQTGFITASSAAAVGLVALGLLGYAAWWKLKKKQKPPSSNYSAYGEKGEKKVEWS